MKSELRAPSPNANPQRDPVDLQKALSFVDRLEAALVERDEELVFIWSEALRIHAIQTLPHLAKPISIELVAGLEARLSMDLWEATPVTIKYLRRILSDASSRGP